MVCARFAAMAAIACIIASAVVFRAGADEAPQTPAPPPACTGRDLLAEAQRIDPAGYQKILERTRQVPNAEGLLWKIDKPNLAPSYLFGTMHATDEDAVAIARSMAGYVRQTKQVATELGAAMGPGTKAVLAVKVAFRALRAKVTTGSLIESAEDRSRLEKALAELHVDIASALKMPPWFVVMLLALPACEVARQQRDLPIVDHVIEDLGKGYGEPILALESIDEQLDAIESLDANLAARAIVLTIGREGFAEDSFATMTALYKQQRIGAMMPTFEIAADLSPDDLAADAALMTTIVEKRNLVMRRRAEPLIDAGPTFVAVGALHLVGAHGLIELLRQDGYTVTRVP
jgi:uncharacterized protein YbaP (TraB family)